MLFLLLIAYLFPTCTCSYGPNYGSGPTFHYDFNKDGTIKPVKDAMSLNFVTYGEATLVLPNAPNAGKAVGNTVLWLGQGTYLLPFGALVQGIINNYPHSQDPKDPCNNLGNEWCVTAFMLTHSYNPTDKHAVAKAGDKVTAIDAYDEKTGLTTQTMLINGVNVSSVAYNVGHMTGYGFANECTTKPCGSLDEHHWINNKFILAKPDPKYILTHGPIGWNAPGVEGQFTSKDGGKTWVAADIKIPAHKFTDV